MKFKVALYPSEQGYSVNALGLPGCWSQGTTEAEALANIAAAIREYLEAEIDSTEGAIIREVEVIVLPVSQITAPSPALRGTVLRYDQPTDPVAEDDWRESSSDLKKT